MEIEPVTVRVRNARSTTWAIEIAARKRASPLTTGPSLAFLGAGWDTHTINEELRARNPEHSDSYAGVPCGALRINLLSNL